MPQCILWANPVQHVAVANAGMYGLGFKDITPKTENQMEKEIKHEMEKLGPFRGVYRDI